jgi:predicted PurR-regulated permease PerM
VLGVYLLLINIKNIWIRPRIFGRSVHMHDGIVFVAIIAAVVLQGILGALIIIPMLASLGIVLRYIWKRVLGEEPFPNPVGESQIEQENAKA